MDFESGNNMGTTGNRVRIMMGTGSGNMDCGVAAWWERGLCGGSHEGFAEMVVVFVVVARVMRPLSVFCR
jgi:hypothetical protein